MQNYENDSELNSVSVIIPVYKPDYKLEILIKRLLEQTICPTKIILLHTLQFEGETLKLKPEYLDKVKIYPIKISEFDHGATRSYGASFADTDTFIFMTQDALPDNNLVIEKLLEALKDEKVAVAYARQLPRKDASFLESYTRNFNYPKKSRIQSKEQIQKLGIKTFFCSDVCACYKARVFFELGGFVKKTIFNEDMIFAFDAIYSDYKIAYVADARVIHSHHYTYREQLRRNFDLGVSHKEYSFLFDHIASEREGLRFVKNMIQVAVKKKKAYLIFDIILSNGLKYIGYQLGKHYKLLPKKLVRALCMNKNYFMEE